MTVRKLITRFKARYLTKNTDFMDRCEQLSSEMISKGENGYKQLTVPINKNYDLLGILRKLSPKSVIELGSGTTSLMFDYYSREAGIDVETREHNPAWHASVSQYIKNPKYRYVLDEMDVLKESTRYKSAYERSYDFMYIDGPPVSKLYNSDFLEIIEQPSLKTIVLDIRDSTAIAIMDYLYEKKRKATIRVHKNFSRDPLKPEYESCFNIKWIRDKRHTIIYLDR